MNAPRQNRTFICSVLFLDIVEYSRKPVATQIRVKERLNRLLTDALRDVAQNDRIILDTGDGVALNFIGNPEDALFAAMSLRDNLIADESPDAAELKLRTGINLGPVRLVKDINGRPNIIGDGINVAQRIMSFARPGQILVSRSYHEIISSLSESYTSLFRYEGSHTDKHVRAHEVYEVGHSLPAGVERMPPEGVGSATAARRYTPAGESLPLTTTLKNTIAHRPKTTAAVAMAVVLAAALGIRMTRAPAPDAMVTPPDKVADAPKLENKVEPRDAPKIEPTVEFTPVITLEPAKTVEPATPPVITPPKPAAEKPPAPKPPVELATVSIAVSPWGEVFVNGARRGVSPPLRELKLPPGQYTIEIRNPGFPAYTQGIQVSAGGSTSVQHKFP